MDLEESIKNLLKELRTEKQRKFVQSVDLIVNLQKIDLKRTSINIFSIVPHKIKDKKICGFLETRSKIIDSITPTEFVKFRDKKTIKKLVKDYDFFIAQSSLMPRVASIFGKVLGPAGKMPSPQLGIIINSDEKNISELISKINKSVRIRLKEASFKLMIGKEDMKDEEICENVISIYNDILKNLPRNKENVKNLQIKFTMTKPKKILIR